MARDVMGSKKHDGPVPADARTNSSGSSASSPGQGWFGGVSKTKPIFLAVLCTGMLFVVINMLTVGSTDDFDGHCKLCE